MSRPFVYGSRIPTHAEMSDVIESPISSEMKLGISAYLRQFQKEGLVEPEMELWEYFENLALDSWRQQLPVKETLVLNRAERNHFIINEFKQERVLLVFFLISI